jgi:thiamine-monophosphate kinase
VLARQPPALRRRFTAAGGDDYELCFTAPQANREAVLAAAAQAGTPVTRVGRIEAAAGLRLVDARGEALDLQLSGWDHFSGR